MIQVPWKPIAFRLMGLACSISLFCPDCLQAQGYQNEIYVRGGYRHTTFLDRQASPLPYEGAGPALSAGVGSATEKRLWQVNVYGGKMAFQPTAKELRFYKREMTAICAGFHLSYLLPAHRKGKWQIWAGLLLKEDLLVDFEGIGTWPYLQAFGGIHAQSRAEYALNEKHGLAFEASIPALAWLTDMPYHQIPRLPGRAPDAYSLFRTSTKIASWNRYQRVDVQFTYSYAFSKRWWLKATYHWAWFHDARPFDMWTYQGTLSAGMAFRW